MGDGCDTHCCQNNKYLVDKVFADMLLRDTEGQGVLKIHRN